MRPKWLSSNLERSTVRKTTIVLKARKAVPMRNTTVLKKRNARLEGLKVPCKADPKDQTVALPVQRPVRDLRPLLRDHKPQVNDVWKDPASLVDLTDNITDIITDMVSTMKTVVNTTDLRDIVVHPVPALDISVMDRFPPLQPRR